MASCPRGCWPEDGVGWADAAIRGLRSLEFLDPGPHGDLVRPGAAMLAGQGEHRLGDGVRVEQAVGRVRRLRPGGAADAAIHDDMDDVDAPRVQLARHALGEAAQRELPHRERRRKAGTPSRWPTRR